MQDPSERRLRFGLREFFMLLTILMLGTALYVIGRQRRDAESELRKLRDEVGRLAVDDPTQLHAIAVDAGEPDTWKWRLLIPQGRRYSWNIATSNIPQNGVPAAEMMGISNEPYSENAVEVLVVAQLRGTESEGWRLSVTSKIGDSKNQMGGVSAAISDENMKWRREIPAKDGRVLGSRGQVIIDEKGPIILLQERACKALPNGDYRPVPEPQPGFVIWLEEI